MSLVVGAAAAGRLDTEFSPAFEGFNAAVWATGARSVREDGWIEARFGGRRGEHTYAHHPPLVQLQASAVATTVGDHRWAYRGIALLSTLAAVWCCWGWLGASGFSPGPRSLGLLVAAGTTLVVHYSVMLNMEMVWMPLAFALLWAWTAARGRDAPSGPLLWACGVLSALGCLAAHQGIPLAFGLGLAGAATARHTNRRTDPADRSVLLGAIVGTVGFLGWVVWVSGGLTDLFDAAATRSGQGVGWITFANAQLGHTVSLFGLLGTAVLVVGTSMAILSDPRRRTVAIVLVGVALSYAVLFRQGATIHRYWNAALLPLVALGAAVVGERIVLHLSRAIWVALSLAAAQLLLFSVGSPTRTLQSDVGLITHRAATSSGADLYSTDLLGDWATYEAGREVLPAYDCAAIEASARDDAARDDAALDDADTLVITSARFASRAGMESRWDDLTSAAEFSAPGAVAVAPRALSATLC